jgi:hypothetical protein
MGLTIHWKLGFKGTWKQAKEKLLKIKSIVSRLPIEKVSNIIEIKKEEMKKAKKIAQQQFEKHIVRDLSIIDFSTNKDIIFGNSMLEKPPYSFESYYPERAIGFTVIVMYGCEYVTISLGDHKVYWTEYPFKNFISIGGCKTQYARDPQFPRFPADAVKAHIIVISILEILKKEHILLYVHDEGRYWETRNIEHLEGQFVEIMPSPVLEKWGIIKPTKKELEIRKLQQQWMASLTEEERKKELSKFLKQYKEKIEKKKKEYKEFFGD